MRERSLITGVGQVDGDLVGDGDPVVSQPAA
jgi:hypothetical protein